jgi:lipopolysaccharide/colanic/teichoic acid biosynthesis glycosyltransferase
MAFIGPRPMPIDYLPYFTEEERLRHTCRGGMSGLAQVNGRTSITWDQKFAYDVEYVRNMSFRQDFKIFFQTIKKVLVQENIGARDEGENIDLDQVRSVQR